MSKPYFATVLSQKRNGVLAGYYYVIEEGEEFFLEQWQYNPSHYSLRVSGELVRFQKTEGEKLSLFSKGKDKPRILQNY